MQGCQYNIQLYSVYVYFVQLINLEKHHLESMYVLDCKTLIHTHTRTHTHARTRIHTHAHTHTRARTHTHTAEMERGYFG